MRKWFVAAALVALLAPTAALPQAKSGKGGVYDQLNLFGEAFERIRQDAVEPVGDGKLIETAISGMLTGLDPHSVYMSEAEYKALQNPTTDESASAGLVVTIENGQLKVISPRDGSPAASADIKPGDIIFTIDKEPTYDLTLTEIEQKLRGPAGSEVALMLRRGTGSPIEAIGNGGTAREAELVAGALQDNKRAVLLGTKTYGESGIETILPLNGNGAIRLTTARYQTPSGRAIQGKGLQPDLNVSPLKLEKVAQADRRREADLRGALKNPETERGSAGKPGGPGAPDKAPGKDATTATPPKGDQPTVSSGDIGTTSDEQLSQAMDVLRG